MRRELRRDDVTYLLSMLKFHGYELLYFRRERDQLRLVTQIPEKHSSASVCVMKLRRKP